MTKFRQSDEQGLRTKRLALRRWRADDLEPFACMNADENVMRHFPKTLSRDETRSFIAGAEAHFEREGFGLYVAELIETGEFLGFIGLSVPRFEASFTPCVEIGWRIARAHWGQGYAPEGGLEVLRYAFEELALSEVVSFTAAENKKSIRVMEKIGMRRGDDFDHPALPDGHSLRRHVLYKIDRAAWVVGS